jgi:hypothetical protein
MNRKMMLQILLLQSPLKLESAITRIFNLVDLKYWTTTEIWSLAFHYAGWVPHPDQSVWDLWWAKWH